MLLYVLLFLHFCSSDRPSTTTFKFQKRHPHQLNSISPTAGWMAATTGGDFFNRPRKIAQAHLQKITLSLFIQLSRDTAFDAIAQRVSLEPFPEAYTAS